MSNSHDSSGSAKLILGGLAVLTVVALVALHLGFGPRWYQGYGPEQPIPFSHKLHAGQYKIPCGYCHSSAEKAQFSAVPGLETCMNCHNVVKPESPHIKKITNAYKSGQPIRWVKVHVLPDFVHFNHRAHVSAGVACETCHGKVEEMEQVYQHAPLSMGWCMDCHRNDDYLTEHRRELLEKQIAMSDEGPQPEWVQWIGGHPQIHNADVSCSTCHY